MTNLLHQGKKTRKYVGTSLKSEVKKNASDTFKM